MASDQGIVVKAYLDSQEIRRFLLETSVATSFDYLKQKTFHIFHIPQGEDVKFSWKDGDNEYIMVSSDEELLEALNHQKDGLFRLYLTRNPSVSPNASAALHSSVVCDGCQGEVRGTRYKCAVCPDYDLCARCEHAGKHLEHDMMCVRRPVNPCDWTYWRDFVQFMSSRGPPAGPPPPPHMGMPRPHYPGFPHWQWGGNPWQCRKMWKKAFKCHQKFQRENSRMRESAACGSTFSPAPADSPKETTEDGQNPSQNKVGEAHKEFLKSMGEAVQSMLDPFGIDVSFSVDAGSSLNSNSDSLQSQSEEKKTTESKEAPQVVDIETDGKKDDTHKSPQDMNVDLDSSPSSPDAQRTAEFIVIDPDDVVVTSPPMSQKVAHSLELMKRMGFKDSESWLSKLLVENDGEIGKVLDIIQSKCKH